MRSVASSIFFGFMVAIFLTGCGTPRSPARDPGDWTAIGAILEDGRASGPLPAGFVVRLEAHLSRRIPADAALRKRGEAQGVDFSKTLDEIWEISADRVHRVAMMPDRSNTRRVYRRTESIPFDSRGICKALLDAQILTLADRQGGGNDNFVGTGFDEGEHMIGLLVDGKTVLSVGETCAEAGFAEDDARAFAQLYEKLAIPARQAFAMEAANKGSAPDDPTDAGDL